MTSAEHVGERMRLSAGRTRLLIDFVLEDPEYLAEPFSGHVEWVYWPHYAMLGFGFGCDRDTSMRYTLE